MTDAFKPYFEAIKTLDIQDATEHTLRTALENLLNAIAQEVKPPFPIKVIHESKKDTAGRGAPDFKFKVNEAILGYLENKKVEENLDTILKSAQLTKYKQLSGNLIVTNYLEWIWLRDGNIQKRETLCYQSDVGNRKAKLDPEKVEKVYQLIAGFYSIPPKQIGRAKDLALALATRCHDLRDYLLEELVRQEKEDEEGRVWGLYKAFKQEVFHELKVTEFADAFAQTLGYGLFLARLNMANEPAARKLTLDNAKRFIPGGFELIRELVSFLDELEKPEYRLAKQPIDEILSIMNTLDLASIHEDLAFTKRQGKLFDPTEEERLLFAKDPYVYFYEDFLKAYDAAMRKGRGVYYTPPPVVNFIIRAINDILKDTFGIQDGLADRKRVTVLDFATGTGTFLIEVLQQIFETVSEGVRDQIIQEHVLKNLYGFEYLIAPYTIAHLKLSQFLQDKGYPLKDKERLRIYLTNTLEPIAPQANLLLPALSKEVKEAQEIKDKQILVITGNPPYNNKSKNPSEFSIEKVDKQGKIKTVKKKTFIGELLGAYKPSDETKLNLDDDYIKFLRFAHYKMEESSEGIIGIITNNSFLSGITHRKMRGKMLKDFERIYIMNLHGNANIGEVAPDGQQDDNVFDIKQGVAIVLFIKTSSSSNKGASVRYLDVYASNRIDKYKILLNSSLNNTDFKLLTIRDFNSLFRQTRWSKRFKDDLNIFIPMDAASSITEYGSYWGIKEIFNNCNSGIQTKRDPITVHFLKEELETVIEDFQSLSSEDIKEKYKNLKDGRDWTLKDAIESLKENPRAVRQITYRPFDIRWTFLNKKSKGFVAYPRTETSKHFSCPNVGLIFNRQVANKAFTHAGCSEFPTAHGVFFLGNKGQDYIAPLYQYSFLDEKERAATLFDSLENSQVKHRIENFSSAFRSFIDQKYNKHYNPEEILGYIYAVLHSPTYRSKYLEFLKIDFPRIPFIDDAATFEKFSALGWELVQAHLLKTIPVGQKVDISLGKKEVEKPVYTEQHQRLYINKECYFSPVPKNVWEFHIGGYQVLDKYLKSREGRTLSLDEIENVGKVVRVLEFTIGQMEKIDQIWQP
jgi:hypothetical protein